ncbi:MULTISPECIES: cytochrome c-type biogenesis protein [Rheinheimera]|jgi:cytochrome c-type biogenesis protein CcmH|uniref:cytochrome c-type biogenesis protein n=1 Tax=Rheinheimera TaxID=67575 RepID=UPI001416F7D5|nr:cytochrome c-type biogenesis protein [Rheinheimera aquimaris]MCD1599802.1 cytochrome c-type biogenesis protein CcmH [Rheinheimera aquimaris]|tara:strand:+ start:1140 stop:1607 length:468 start_codon:yes stop_codon:yes gene_type:complete
MKALLAVLLLCAGLFSSGPWAEEVLQFDNDAQRDLYQQLTAELRCPQCQNQNIADSHAVVAVDMREKTYQLIREGKDRQQVLDYMINRYGDFVHYLPPVNRYTLWLWLLPLLMLLGLIAVGVFRRAQQSKQVPQDIAGNTTAELDQLIARYRSKK